jgi:DNA-binding MarR family transcriptional regulator
MNLHDLRLFELLDSLNQKDAISQRELSNTLNVSLGSVNASLKHLYNKELILKKSSTPRRMSYQLTKKGFAEKERLSHLYWQQSIDRYTKMRSKIENQLSTLQKNHVKKIVFFGAGQVAEIAYIALIQKQIQLTGIVDEAKKGEWFLNFRILSPTHIDSIPFNKILVTDLNINAQCINENSWLKKLENFLVFINI